MGRTKLTPLSLTFKMDFTEIKYRIKDGFKAILNLDKESLKNIRITLVLLLLVDLFGFYWYLKNPFLGKMGFIFLVLALAVVVGLEQRKVDIEEINTKEENENVKR